MIFKAMKHIVWASISFSLIGCGLPISTPPTPEITSITSFKDVNFEHSCDSKTLVLFDVDETLIQPEDAYLVNEHTLEGQRFRENLIKDHPEITNWEQLQAIMLLEAKRPLIEPFITEIVSRLKENGTTVMALTAMNTGPYGHVGRLEAWRHAHLRSLGFTGSFSTHQFFLRGFKRKPVFFKGIIATDLEDKGAVFGAVLDYLTLRPHKVIFFDDTLDFLLSLRRECLRRGIKFQGYHYLGYARKSWDQPLFIQQAQHLIKHKHWLDDHTAKERLSLKN